jgi:hypothetical protein
VFKYININENKLNYKVPNESYNCNRCGTKVPKKPYEGQVSPQPVILANHKFSIVPLWNTVVTDKIKFLNQLCELLSCFCDNCAYKNPNPKNKKDYCKSFMMKNLLDLEPNSNFELLVTKNKERHQETNSSNDADN